MRRSKNKILIIVLIVIAVLLIAGGFAYAYFCTDIFRSGQELFLKYLSQDVEEMKQTLSWENFNQLEAKLGQSKYEETMKVSYLEDNQTKPTTELTIDTQKDNIDGKTYMHIALMAKELEEALELEYMQEEDAHSVRFTSISKDLDFVTVKNKNLKKLAEKCGLDKSEIDEIPNEIDFEEFSLEGLAFTESEKQEEINKYLNVIYNNIPKEKYTKNKDVVITVNGNTITTNAYVLTLGEQDIKDLGIKVLEELKKDEIIVAKLNTLYEKLQNLDASMENIDVKENYEQAIQELIDNLSEAKVTGENKIVITVYEQDGKTVRIKLEEGMDYITIDTTIAESNKQIDINFTRIDTDTTQLSYQVKFIKENENKLQILFTNIDGEQKLTFEVSVGIEQSDKNTKIDYNIINTDNNKISLSRDIKFVDEIQYKVKLDKSNNIVLNDLNESQIETLVGILGPRLNSSYVEKIDSLSQDTIVPMVALPITALVVAEPKMAVSMVPMAAVTLLSFNVKQEATEPITNIDLSEAEITQFNSEFTMYEGSNVSASRVNALLTMVNSHNMEQALEGEEKYVAVSGIVTFTKDDITVPKVENGKYYKVVCRYEDGIVNEIVVVNPEDEIPVEENNELTPEEIDNGVTMEFSESEKETFNSRFTMYEGGVVSKSRVSAMLNAVFSHNNQEKAAGTQNYVVVTGDVELDQSMNSTPKIGGNAYYNVKCEYEDGLINRITVTKNQ